MATPRYVRAGITYMVQRRCTQRQMLMVPTATVNEVFLYSLAYAARETGVQVHAFCCLSNHFHLVLTDPSAVLPEFMRILDGFIARALNLYHDRRENFWAPGSYSAVRLVEREDVMRKLVYTLTNPVSAGLVAFGTEWPGQRTDPEDVGTKRLEATRPKLFFRSTMPERISLCLSIPPACAGDEDRPESDDEFRRELRRECFEQERGVRNEFHSTGKRFLGREAVMGQQSTDTPRSPERLGRLDPRVACIDKWRRIEILQRLVEFLARYREALSRFLCGERDVEFPAGTYWMRVHFAVRCEAPP